jgi:hypothetical protein
LFPHHRARHLGQEGGTGRVGGAGEHEVLPDQQPFAVAQLVEQLPLVLASPPDPEHVHVGLHGAFQQGLVPFQGLAGRQGVAGDPVGPLAEDVHPIDPEDQATARLVVLAAHLQAAEADALGQGRFPGPDPQGLQGLRSVACRPPELRVANQEGLPVQVEAGAHLQDSLGARPGRFDLQGQLGRPVGEELHHDLQLDPPRREALHGVHPFQAPDGAAPDESRPVDPARHQAGAPVPAAVALRLAHQVAVRRLHRVPGMGQRIRQGPAPGRSLVLRGTQEDLDEVFPFAQRILELRSQGHEHVRAPGHELPVDSHLGHRVHPLQVEEGLAVAKEAAFDREAAGKQPVGAADPLNLELLGTVIGIGDQARMQQSGKVVSGDTDRHRAGQPGIGFPG